MDQGYGTEKERDRKGLEKGNLESRDPRGLEIPLKYQRREKDKSDTSTVGSALNTSTVGTLKFPLNLEMVEPYRCNAPVETPREMLVSSKSKKGTKKRVVRWSSL
eukprot:TRINITY_DN28321_c0_g1_i1.p1 TRINITY_DN28321_c0_g1~~TRINITY_DN28321_c0_g1_i1.p1  ORF type:complete len:120 (-),score=26.86 TRINITY_DN28321_c0_g1_i1:62-376(-)